VGRSSDTRTVDIPDRGQIVFDFNLEGHLVGIEVLGARALLPPELLETGSGSSATEDDVFLGALKDVIGQGYWISEGKGDPAEDWVIPLPVYMDALLAVTDADKRNQTK
jgi:hypothetical protein